MNFSSLFLIVMMTVTLLLTRAQSLRPASGLRIDDYTFYQGQDSAQGDITYLPGRTAQQLKDFCNRDATCIGFSTKGWLKSSLGTRSEWYRWSEATDEGIYVKAGSYMYYPGLDSSLGDIVHLPGLTVNELKVYCDSDSSCVGFNTNGWIKNSLQSRSEWHSWSMSAEEGLYVKYRASVTQNTCFRGKAEDLRVESSTTLEKPFEKATQLSKEYM